MPRNKSRKTLVVVGLQLERDLVQKVDALAEQETRSRAGQLRWMVQRVLREFERAGRLTHTPDEASDGDRAAIA